MATIKEVLFDALNIVDFELARNNAAEQSIDLDVFIDETDSDILDGNLSAYALDIAFNWSNSNEEFDYWSAIYDKLENGNYR